MGLMDFGFGFFTELVKVCHAVSEVCFTCMPGGVQRRDIPDRAAGVFPYEVLLSRRMVGAVLACAPVCIGSVVASQCSSFSVACLIYLRSTE